MRRPSGLVTVTAQDFIQVLDSSALLEEGGVTARIETTSELGREEEDAVALQLCLASSSICQPAAHAPLPRLAVPKPAPPAEWHKLLTLHRGC